MRNLSPLTEHVYPLPRRQGDSRLSPGLLESIAAQIAAHGFPPVCLPGDRAQLAAAVLDFLYNGPGRSDIEISGECVYPLPPRRKDDYRLSGDLLAGIGVVLAIHGFPPVELHLDQIQLAEVLRGFLYQEEQGQ
ncbi:hypothetical protein ACFOSC_26830 [Streptantibioticus rubrisoli]|uniref:Uncharacterized protein n=1 Tax=Streptantibioticus rubrisoli TaxID=1387313 RepID=A0ABT1PLP1_9ACTN|nr:hypothetical protein [Streptantibioticus rubrisoli]MCQ4046272.1 hypothetical protein [Streptantibioticus rubrisoli]